MIRNTTSMLKCTESGQGIECWELMGSKEFQTCIHSAKELVVTKKQVQKYQSKDVFYYILYGHGVFEVEALSQQVGLRDLIYIPAEEEHVFFNLSPKMRMLEITISECFQKVPDWKYDKL